VLLPFHLLLQAIPTVYDLRKEWKQCGSVQAVRNQGALFATSMPRAAFYLSAFFIYTF